MKERMFGPCKSKGNDVNLEFILAVSNIYHRSLREHAFKSSALEYFNASVTLESLDFICQDSPSLLIFYLDQATELVAEERYGK